MLEYRPHLDLKAVGEAVHGADVVEGHIAETVYLVDLSLVYGILPVHLEEAFHGRCHLVYIVNVEGDDADAHYIRNIGQGGILGAFQFKFAGKGLLRFHAGFYGGHYEPRLLENLLKGGLDLDGGIFAGGFCLPVFFQDSLAMRV